jgi:hypothetical protein
MKKEELYFDLEVLENFLCPKCRRKKEWTESPICFICGYDERNAQKEKPR